jgi:hypothetical protein
MRIRLLLITAFVTLAGASRVFGQNVISTAVPFLSISPDSRSGALGDAGVAISPDANSIYWNPAKLAFSEKRVGVALSYSPWLRNLVNDMSLSYLSGYYKWDDKQAVGLALTYFDLGSIEFRNDQGGLTGNATPRETAITASYSRKLGRTFSMAVNLRFINSNLTGEGLFGQSNIINGAQSNPGNTAAGDIGAFYTKDMNWGGKDINLALGGMISNLGGKIAYNNTQNDFIPTNLRLGSALTYNVDVYNKFVLALDFNKLMVPTPRLVEEQRNGRTVLVNANANKGFIPGVFGSFSDAPGGFSEELQEVSIATGLEYWYNDTFALRGGYFGENRNKGNRKYFTLGLGFRYNQMGFDFAYLFPQGYNSPLANTLRFSLQFNIDQPKAGTRNDITN